MIIKLMKLTILSALLVAMVPAASVFAETDNTVNKVPTVAAGTEFTEEDAPRLRIEEARVGEFAGENQEFELQLSNAVWSADAAELLEEIVPELEGVEITFEQHSETKMGILITGAGLGSDPYRVDIPLISIVGQPGTVRCTVNALGSWVSDGVYTYAKVAETEKSVRVFMSELVDADSASKKFTLEDVVIEESSANVLVNSGKNGKVPVKIFLQLKDGLKFASAEFDSSAFGGLSKAVLKGKLKGRTQLEITLDASQRVAALRGGITVSDLQLTGRKLKSTTEIFMDVIVQSGTFTSEQTLLAGTCTVEDLRLKELSLGDDISMSPAFDPDIYRYKAVVPKTMDTISLNFASMNFGTPVTLYNESIGEGESVIIPLKVGKNTIKLTVGDSERGKVSKPYIIEVMRSKK